MPKRDLIFRNPLRVLGGDGIAILPEGGFGAVIARAGVGKTSFLVQIALERMLHQKDVLHVSLTDPLDKVCLWYDELLGELSTIYDKHKIKELWEEAKPHRFILTFLAEEFSPAALEHRFIELKEQNILNPSLILIDGLSFEKDEIKETLGALKSFAKKYDLRLWFSVRTHRQTDTDPDKYPPEIEKRADFFDIILRLQPNRERKEVEVKVLKSSGEFSGREKLSLDPKTMLVVNDEG